MSISISRRDAIAALGSTVAAIGLSACGGGSSGGATPPPLNITYDLIVVGAGIAGISAARTARAYNANVLVLEAQDHIGGRAFTDTTTFSEIGFDLGAQFFQAVLSGNELYDMAVAQGLPLLASAGSGPPESLASTITKGTVAANATDVGNLLFTLAAIKKAIFDNGALIAAGAIPDAPVSSFVSSLTGLPWYIPAAAQSFVGIVGGDYASMLDLYTYSSIQPLPFATPGDDYIVKTGMGTFVRSLASGLRIMTNSPVSSITTGGQTVSVVANGVTYQAKKIIVTAPTNYLAKSNTANGTTFNPPLPSAYIDAFGGLPLVPVYKALLGFKSGFNVPFSPPAPPATSFSVVVPLVNSEISTFFPNFWGTTTCEFIADGALAQQLDAAGNAGAAALLLNELEGTFPGATAAWDGRITGSSWMSNKYFGGAFSAALPGQYPSRALISKPIGNQLWFAGEAASTEHGRGLLQAAFRSGAAAAAAALKTIGLAEKTREGALK